MARKSLRTRLWWLLKWLVAAGFAVVVVLPLLFFLVFYFVPVPVTSFMVLGTVEGELLEEKPYQLKHDWVALEEMSPWLARAVIASEDQKFIDHFGLDIEAMEKALAHNQRSKRVRGGSTISQQLVKNIFLWPGRSYVRKALEAWLTLMMEVVWSKERIMEVYLNSAEFGRGVYGAEAAAQHHFRKSAKKLTRREAALLAAVLPAPTRYNAGRPSPYVQQRAAWIEAQMARIGPVEQEFTGKPAR